jgi:hypothetical protein
VAACARWRGLGVLQSSRRGPLDSPTARHGVGGGEKVMAKLSMMSPSTMVDSGMVSISLVSVNEKEVVREVHHDLE